MHSSRRFGLLVPLAAVALLAVALLAPSAHAATIPPLSQSAQYKALVSFVDKLRGLENSPTTIAQKTAYEGQLENKHEAAVNKSTALFNRGKTLARNEANRSFKAGSRTVRRTEAGELAALRREYDARMTRSAANYQAELGRLEDEFDARAATLNKEIKRLRKQKANATGAVQKAQIQEAIERRTERLTADAKLEKEEIADLKAGYRKEKEAIRSAKASATQVVQQNDNEAIQRLRTNYNRIYNTRVRTLQSRRTNQVADLEAKFNSGREAIAKMPTSG